MYKRIIVVVASALFALLALLAVVITDLYDQDYPLAIGVESKIHLDYSESEASIMDAFTTLEKLDGQLDLGLLKIAPDLANDSDSKVYVSLNDQELPSE
ncbi:hypothetical protein SAMN05216389_11299 [Oceanobacillus limi]|uniref:Uncharacterized protein n=1 Tax=Oceanobacillus limi TaxID=930131 RepID=A0A1I0ETN7_9BACI|nr:hypothetical protein [Oceanobacillus limi]SET48800.1 hypothetical protein SAMN05216389_11299 [Oceanobacillus limi]